jgi:protein-S-isoprenylcysteine O-methyltransferase Ste14
MLAACLLVGFGSRALVPLAFAPRGIALSLGPFVVVLAFALFLWAALTMRRSGASIPTGEPTTVIVRNGPYRYSRNPIYVAMLMLLVGVGIWSNSLWFLGLAVFAGVLLTWGVISREEAYLGRKFGSEYESYKSRVRRWL